MDGEQPRPFSEYQPGPDGIQRRLDQHYSGGFKGGHMSNALCQAEISQSDLAAPK